LQKRITATEACLYLMQCKFPPQNKFSNWLGNRSPDFKSQILEDRLSSRWSSQVPIPPWTTFRLLLHVVTVD